MASQSEHIREWRGGGRETHACPAGRPPARGQGLAPAAAAAAAVVAAPQSLLAPSSPMSEALSMPGILASRARSASLCMG